MFLNEKMFGRWPPNEMKHRRMKYVYPHEVRGSPPIILVVPSNARDLYAVIS
jgi:hypothetical protein